MNLSREITAKLPDWFNPVLVKELRQTLHSKAFWVTSLIIAAIEAAVWLHVRNIPSFNVGKMVLTMQLVLSWLWLVGTVCILQPAISRWAEERHLDAIAPERTTSLSAWQILSGKLGCYALVILWTALLVAPLIAYLLVRINSAMDTANEIVPQVNTCGVLCGALLSFVMVLNLNIWAVLTAMTVRIRRNATGGVGFFGWLVVVVGTMHVMSYGSAAAILFAEHQVTFGIILFFLIAVLIYGMLLAISQLKPEQSNRMFPARLGGWVLLTVAGTVLWILYKKEWIGQLEALIGILSWMSLYISFQSFLAAMEPLEMPKRMYLDAPKNLLAKAFWFSCGTGAVCAWVHLLIPFAVLNVLFFCKCGGEEAGVFLMIALGFNCYAIIYGAVTALLRIACPKLNGGVIYITIAIAAVVFDLLVSIKNPEIAYASPGHYLLRQLMEVMQNNDPDSSSIYTLVTGVVKPIISVAWCMICLMLLATGYAAQKKSGKQ